MRTAFDDEGDLRATDVLSALVTLWRQGASGSLHFSRSGATAGFFLAEGELTAVSSSESRFETASILLRAGKLDAATLERLTTPEGGDRALSALQAGVLTKREWRWGEKIRAVEILSDLLTWIEGDYVLDRAARREEGEFRLTIPRLVLELFLRSRDRSLVLHYLGGADVPLARAPRFDAEFNAFGLTADAEAVVRLIDGKRTAGEIASEGPADAFAVEKLLAALVTLGLVHPEFGAAEPAGSPEVEEGEERGEAPRVEPLADEDGDSTVRVVLPVPQADVGEAPYPGDLDSEEVEVDVEFPEDSVTARLPNEEFSVEDQAMRGQEDSVEDAGIAAQGLHERIGADDGSPLDRATLDAAGSTAARSEDARFGGARNIPGDPGPAPEFDRPLDLTTGVGSIDRPKARSSGPLLLLLAFLAAGVGAVIVFRARSSSTPTPGLASRTTPTSAVPTPAVPTPAAEVPFSPTANAAPSPTAMQTVFRPARTVPAQRTAARSTVSAAVPTPRTVKPPPEPAPAGTRQAWLDRAARDRQRALGDRKAHFAIQLELACEVSTLVDAWGYDRPAGTLWVMTTPFQGKTCFRVLWGRYPTKEAARRAVSGVPPFFSNPRSHPVVTAIR